MIPGRHFSSVVSSSVPFLVQTCLKELEHPLVSVPESLGGESMPLRRVNVRVTFQFCLRAQLRKLKRVVHRNIRVFTPVEDAGGAACL